ncbi:katanin p60 ATPase-containing subunit A1-like isoform X1, partial [Brachionus plicatilis]
ARHNRDPLGARRPLWQQQAPQRVERQLGTPPITRAHGINGDPCPICLEQFENCNSIVETVCGHRACENCMYQNVRHGNRNCPLCRSSLGQVPYRLINEHNQELMNEMEGHLKEARRSSILGNYDGSMVFYEGVLLEIQQLLQSNYEEPKFKINKQKLIEYRKMIEAELDQVKEIQSSLNVFKNSVPSQQPP